LFIILNIVRKRKKDYIFYAGSNWTNYTHACVGKILNYLEYDKGYINRFKWTMCADEIFFQTIINKLDGITVINNCLRYMDWKTGPEYPRTLREDDYEQIMKTDNVFARKFDDKVDNNIINRIYEEIVTIQSHKKSPKVKNNHRGKP
jgi:hypothetical protein